MKWGHADYTLRACKTKRFIQNVADGIFLGLILHMGFMLIQLQTQRQKPPKKDHIILHAIWYYEVGSVMFVTVPFLFSFFLRHMLKKRYSINNCKYFRIIMLPF